MQKNHTIQSYSQHLSSFNQHFCSIQEDDQFSKIVIHTPRQVNQQVKSGCQKIVKYPLQQIPQNTMEMYNSDRKKQRIGSTKQLKKNSELQKHPKIMVNQIELQKYKRPNIISSLDIHNCSQNETVNTGSRVIGCKNTKFWTKKGVFSETQWQNNQHNRNNSQSIRKNSQSRKNNLKIKQRNCLSVCSVPAQNSQKSQNDEQTYQNSEKIQIKTKKFDDTIQISGQKKDVHKANINKNAIENQRILSMKIRTQPHQKLQAEDQHSNNAGLIIHDNRNKFNHILERQRNILIESTSLLRQKSTKLPFIQNLNSQVNKIFELTIKVIQQRQNQDKQLAMILKNHLELSQAIYWKTQNYCHQWVEQFNYEETIRKNLNLLKQNQKLRIELEKLKCKVVQTKEVACKQSLVRQNKIDLDRLSVTLHMNPLKVCQQSLPKKEISESRFQEICSSMIQMIIKRQKPINNEKELNLYRIKDNKENYEEANKNHNNEVSNSVSLSSYKRPGSCSTKKYAKLEKYLHPKILSEKQSSSSIGFYQLQIIQSIIPLDFASQQGKIHAKKLNNKQIVGFLKKLSHLQSNNTTNKCALLLKKIMQCPFIQTSNTNDNLGQIFDEQMFVTISKTSINYKNKIKMSLFIQLINKFTFLNNKQRVINFFEAFNQQIGKYLQVILREQIVDLEAPEAQESLNDGNLSSNRRYVNCMSLYESKMKLNAKSTNNMGQKNGFNFNRRYQNKSINSLSTSNAFTSNKNLETILNSINEEGFPEKKVTRTPFFGNQSSKQQSLNKFLDSQFETSESIAIVYFFFKAQLKILVEILMGKKVNSQKMIQILQRQLSVKIGEKVIEQIESIFKLQALNQKLYDYIEAEKQENLERIIKFSVYSLVRIELIRSIV